jgi:hypothetical protein
MHLVLAMTDLCTVLQTVEVGRMSPKGEAEVEPPAAAPEALKQNGIKEDQWSPQNPEGKKQYNREFLIRLQRDPLSLTKPNYLPAMVMVEDKSGNGPRDGPSGGSREGGSGPRDRLAEGRGGGRGPPTGPGGKPRMHDTHDTIELVFEKAVDEPGFSVAYARMCQVLQMNLLYLGVFVLFQMISLMYLIRRRAAARRGGRLAGGAEPARPLPVREGGHEPAGDPDQQQAGGRRQHELRAAQGWRPGGLGPWQPEQGRQPACSQQPVSKYKYKYKYRYNKYNKYCRFAGLDSSDPSSAPQEGDRSATGPSLPPISHTPRPTTPSLPPLPTSPRTAGP